MNPSKKMKMGDTDLTLPDHIIFEEVLTRARAETLMRCKSVSKLWYHRIKHHRRFIRLHHTQSMKHRKVFIEEPLGVEDPRNDHSVIKQGATPYCFVTADVEEEGNIQAAGAAYIYSMSTGGLKGMTPFCYRKHPGAVNGLTCFFRYYEPHFSVCVFNVGTRELTPWLKSRVKHELRTVAVEDDLGFGYSPATKEHKLLWKWSTSHPSNMNNGPQGGVNEVWEVLTVGQNTWRVITDEVPFFVGRDAVSTYVNGVIYWLPKSGNVRYVGNLTLAAFDVSTEKFRKIEIVDFDHGPAWDDEFGVCIHLLEVDGAVAVLRRLNENYAMLWKYDECNEKTTREILKFPEVWDGNCQYYFHTGFQRNHVIAELHNSHKYPRLFSCNLRRWNLRQEIQVEDGVFPRVDDVLQETSILTFYSESLLRLASLPREPEPDDVNATNLVIQKLDGSKIRRRFLKSDKLQSVFDFIDGQTAVEPGTYRLMRSLGHCESLFVSLGDLGMTSNEEVLSVQLLEEKNT